MASIKGNDKILLCFYFSRLDGSLFSCFAFHRANCLFNSLANVEGDINVLLFRTSLFIIVINMMSVYCSLTPAGNQEPQHKIQFFLKDAIQKIKDDLSWLLEKSSSVILHHHNELSPLTRSGVKQGLKISCFSS